MKAQTWPTPAIVFQPLGEGLGLAKILKHLPAFTELAQHRPQLEANLEGLFQRSLAFRQYFENTQCLLEPGAGIQERRACGRLPSRLPEIQHCLLLQFAPDGMSGEPLDLLTQPVGVQHFYGIHRTRVDVAAAFVEHPAIGDVVGEGVLESVLQRRKELCRVEKFGGLQIVEHEREACPPSAHKSSAGGPMGRRDQ